MPRPKRRHPAASRDPETFITRERRDYMDTILGLLAIAVIGWYFLAKKNPEKFASFLRPPYGKKRGVLCLVALLVIGAVGATLDPPPASTASQKVQQASDKAEKEANPEKASDHHKLAVQQIADGTGVDEARAAGILDIFHKVGIRDSSFDEVHSYENGKHDTPDEKVFVIETTPVKSFLYLDPNNQVLEVRANAKNLYKNGRALMTYDNSFK